MKIEISVCTSVNVHVAFSFVKMKWNADFFFSFFLGR